MAMTHKEEQSRHWGPVLEKDRIATLDVLRGVAILAMLLANILIYAFPLKAPNMTTEGANPADQLVAMLLALFIEGKIYVLFAILFGMSLALQSKRAEDCGRDFTKLYIRRLIVLILFGISHGLLLYVGDILTFYAIIAFIALLFRKIQPKLLLKIAIAISVCGMLIQGSYAIRNPGAALPSAPDWQQLLETHRMESQATTDSNDRNPGTGQLAKTPPFPLISVAKSLTSKSELELYEFMADEHRIFRSGAWGEMVLHRSVNYFFVLLPLKVVFLGCWVLALFLLGIYFTKRSFFLEAGRRRDVYKTMMFSGFVIGMILQFAGGAAQMAVGKNIMLLPVFLIGIFVGGLGLSLSYAGSFTILCMKKGRSKLVRPVAAVGRMALTNYLGQSVICGLIFYSFGFGLFGQLHLWHAALMTLPIIVFQFVFSTIWLRFFQFGPAEWLWRSLSYWQLQPILRKK
jgi:uncharacterized protein